MKTMRVTCTICDSGRVYQYSPEFPGLLICQECGWLWQEEDEPDHHRQHKTEREREELQT
jgi:hypothetical protein